MSELLDNHVVFLIGDTGKPKLDEPDEVLELLRMKLESAGRSSSVIFLGDNIYPNGLPPLGHERRELSEKRLVVQLDILKNYKGNIFFISGNHDWNKGKKGGLEYVKRQEAYIESYLNRENIYFPRQGCPGPEEVNINNLFKIVFINTQWWVQRGKVPIGSKDGCRAKNEEDFFMLLDKMLNEDLPKLVIGHHPLYSKAIHGGVFSPKQHLFPLRFFNKHLYIPIPGAGSLYPLYRKYFGVVEDISYPPYKKMKKKLLPIFRKYKGLIYASGHDHNLQYIKKGEQHYIISGSGCKAAYVKKGKSSIFSYSVKGFVELVYSKGEPIQIIAWEASKFYPAGNRLYNDVIQ